MVSGENQGYAVFSDIPVLDGTHPGQYPVQLQVTYQVIGSEELRSVSLTAAVQVNVTYRENCQCCEHCVLCFTQDKLPAAQNCACVGELGVSTGCSCDCPFQNPDDVAPEAEEKEEPLAPQQGEQLGEGEGKVNAQRIDCGCTCHATPRTLDIMSAAAVWNDGIIVYSFAELQSVVQGGQYKKVYLGYNTANQGTIRITDADGIAVPYCPKQFDH